MTRDNESWVAHLSSQTAEREVALADLRDALLRSLRKVLSGRSRLDDAFHEDAVQDSLLRILDRLDQFEGRSRFLTWATSIAIRVALGELRRSRWKDVSLDETLHDSGIEPHHAVDTSAGPAVQAERQAMFDTMYELIETHLSQRQRAALVAELKGMPQDEIARHLGSNRNAIYKLTHDARRKLKSGLEAAGYTAEEVLATTGN